MDNIDRKILHILQRNSEITLAEIGAKVRLGTTPVHRRIGKLEESKVIIGRHAVLDPAKVGCPVTAFVHLKIDGLNDALERKFTGLVGDMDEVVGCWRVSGSHDYMVRLALPSLSAYGAWYAKTAALIDIKDATVNFAVATTKIATSLPLDWMQVEAA